MCVVVVIVITIVIRSQDFIWVQDFVVCRELVIGIYVLVFGWDGCFFFIKVQFSSRFLRYVEILKGWYRVCFLFSLFLFNFV